MQLQWHITERCNHRCTHCYQGRYAGRELSGNVLLRVVRQFEDLLVHRRSRRAASSLRGRVLVTGGEPFLHDDVWKLLEALAASEDLEYGILSNGSLLDAEATRRLAELGPIYVQLSLEGGRTTNDGIRGPGSYDRAVQALERLADARIPTVISFTAHRGNYHEFAEVARLGVRLGVKRVWADRMVPLGAGAHNLEPLTDPQETRDLFEIMRRARADASRSFCRTEISVSRALQFLVAGGAPYRCSAGGNLLALMPDGDVYPCRRMPIRVGNVMESTLAEIHEHSPLLRALRDPHRVPRACRGCRHAVPCGGGLRCLSHAVTGDPFGVDPGCWHARSRNAASSGTP